MDTSQNGHGCTAYGCKKRKIGSNRIYTLPTRLKSADLVKVAKNRKVVTDVLQNLWTDTSKITEEIEAVIRAKLLMKACVSHFLEKSFLAVRLAGGKLDSTIT